MPAFLPTKYLLIGNSSPVSEIIHLRSKYLPWITLFLSLNLSNKQNRQTPNLTTLFEEDNKVIRSKFVDYRYSTKIKKTKIRFQKYSTAQKILPSDTGERLHISLITYKTKGT